MTTIILSIALLGAPRCEGGVCHVPQGEVKAKQTVKHEKAKKRGFRLFRGRGCRGGRCG